jgi:hypothetical protein
MEEYIKKDTGEVVKGKLIQVKEGDKVKIISKKQNEVIKKSYDIQYNNDIMKEYNQDLGGFIFVLFQYCNTIFPKQKEITEFDISKLFYLATFINYKGCLNMNRNELQKILLLSRKNFDLFYNKMIKNNIFTIKNKIIYINKKYFIKGNIAKINDKIDYTRMYVNSIRYLYNHIPIRSHSKLGNYFKLIPYIHRQRNILCKNPSSEYEDIKPMELKDLKEILGYTGKSLKVFIKTFLLTYLDNGEPVLMYFNQTANFWESKIIVNPKVFYGGNNITNNDFKLFSSIKSLKGE